MGLELIMESLNLHDQIYGIIHPEVARMYLAISNVYFSLDDKPMAFDLARKSVIIAERTLGLDANETVLAYLNLGLLEHARGHSAVALRFVLHALELSKTAYGADHPEAVTMVTNGALMLQSLRRYHESRVWFEAAARLSDAAHAGQPPTTAAAQLLFQLAQALALDRDSSGAVRRMRESRQMFEALLGPDDKSTREADTWLQSLTTNAVSVARRQKDIASGKLRKLNLFANGLAGSGGARKLGGASSAAGTGPAAAAAGAAAAAAAGTGVARGEYAVDMRNIDDLIKYIDGDDAKTKANRKKRSNPRRRGGATMA
jgi:protein TIF31